MENISIKAAYSAGWSAFARRPWYLIGLLFAFMGIFILSLGNAVVTALAYILYAGYLTMLLRHLRGDTIEFDDLFTVDRRWVYFAFLGVIKMILIMLGLICFIIPGVYLAIRWMFAEFLVIDQGMKPLEALRASSELTAGHRWKLFFFTLLTMLLATIGLLFLVIGSFIVAIIATLAMMHIYDTVLLMKASEADTVEITEDVTVVV